MRPWLLVVAWLGAVAPSGAQPFAPAAQTPPALVTPLPPEATPGLAFAARQAVPEERPSTTQELELKPSPNGPSWLAGWGLAVAGIAFGVGAAGAIARWRRDRASPALATVRLRVTASARLGPKAHVALVSVGGQQLLLAVTDTNVTELTWQRDATDDSPLQSEYEDPLEAEEGDLPLAREARERLPRASTARPAPLAPRFVDASRLTRFQELLRGASTRLAQDGESDPGDHAAELAAQTVDVIASGGGRRGVGASSRRKARTPVPKDSERPTARPKRRASVEGQVAGLKRMRG